jgi:short subunit dehydrogenase-like uncharacterized protein
MSQFLIYGANGYSGRLAAEHAVQRGLRPILAGRTADRVHAVARELGLDVRVFALNEPGAVRDGLSGVTAVLHAAGPFSATAQPMADACLQTGTHYIDITGEIAVLEALAARDVEARSAGVVLLPGAGFDVVPSDCLAAHVKRRLPAATRLRLGIGVVGMPSRGTARSMLEALGRGTQVRHGGRIVELQRAPRARIDFGNGPEDSIGASWGDVATAWYSTGIPDIDVFFRATPPMKLAAAAPAFVQRLLASAVMKRFAARQIERRLPPGPSPAQRARRRSIIVAEAWDAGGARVVSRLETVEAYELTARTAVEIVRRVALGDVTPGYHTPTTAFGADFILEFDGTSRSDR